MSYRPQARDSSRATPYFYSRNNYPVKTHRSSYFDMAQSAIVTRKLGQVKPFWVKGLDYGVKGYRKYNQLRKKYPWLRKRYTPFYPWLSNAKKRSPKFQKSTKLRSRVNRSKYKYAVHCKRRGRFGRCRTNRRNRYRGAYR